MKHKTSFSLVFVSRIVIALVFLFITQPVVGARSPESAGVVETTQDAFSAAASVPGVRFVHTATDDNCTGWRSLIDHPLTNNNPNAILFVTENWNPGGGEIGMYNDPPIGVYYDISPQKWIIFNQDTAAMPIGAAFNVLIPSVDTSVFVHTATGANIVQNLTYIDHPLTNDNPNAIVFVTQNSGPGAGVGVFNNHPTGVFYDDGEQKWGIFNQDTTAAMPLGAAFNVLIPPSGADIFVHTATAGNIALNHTFIDHPLTNKNPNAIVFVTQN